MEFTILKLDNLKIDFMTHGKNIQNYYYPQWFSVMSILALHYSYSTGREYNSESVIALISCLHEHFVGYYRGSMQTLNNSLLHLAFFRGFLF